MEANQITLEELLEESRTNGVTYTIQNGRIVGVETEKCPDRARKQNQDK